MASAEELAELHRLSNDYDPVILVLRRNPSASYADLPSDFQSREIWWARVGQVSRLVQSTHMVTQSTYAKLQYGNPPSYPSKTLKLINFADRPWQRPTISTGPSREMATVVGEVCPIAQHYIYVVKLNRCSSTCLRVFWSSTSFHWSRCNPSRIDPAKVVQQSIERDGLWSRLIFGLCARDLRLA